MSIDLFAAPRPVNYARLWRESVDEAIIDNAPLVPGFWLVRRHRRAPEVPAMIGLCDHEPGNPENKLDRKPYFVAAIGGEECDPYDVQRCRSHRPISEAEYNFRTAERAWAKEFKPDDAAALDARKAADLTKLEPIF